jgi:hypothetical protein
MIHAQFKLAGDIFDIIVDGNNLMFQDIGTGMITSVEGLRLSKAGVLKEHPDLKDDSDWKKIAIDRLKEHVKKYRTEMEKVHYVKDELNKFGYDALMYQQAGFRPKRFK